jgi:hypothetical protein
MRYRAIAEVRSDFTTSIEFRIPAEKKTVAAVA